MIGVKLKRRVVVRLLVCLALGLPLVAVGVSRLRPTSPSVDQRLEAAEAREDELWRHRGRVFWDKLRVARKWGRGDWRLEAYDEEIKRTDAAIQKVKDQEQELLDQRARQWVRWDWRPRPAGMRTPQEAMELAGRRNWLLNRQGQLMGLPPPGDPARWAEYEREKQQVDEELYKVEGELEQLRREYEREWARAPTPRGGPWWTRLRRALPW